MLYLTLSIVAVVIIVAITIRRLPYLRTTRLGLDIMSAPKPYIGQSSPLADTWNRIRAFFSNITISMGKNRYPVSQSAPSPLIRQSYTPAEVPVSARRSESTASTLSLIEEGIPMTAHPGDFWQEETPVAAPLEIPAKGLITRRGESQKIAHELVLQADEAFRKKNYKDAEKYYLQAATKDPDNARIYNRLGVIYLNTKNYKDAVEAFRGALKFDDRVASRHFNLALAYLGKRDLRSAEKGLKEAIRLEPTNEKYRKTLQAIQKQPV